MSIEQMKNWLLRVEPYAGNVTWIARVKAMPENQAVALYFKFLNQGKFDRRPKKKEKKSTEFRQMTLYDIGLE